MGASTLANIYIWATGGSGSQGDASAGADVSGGEVATDYATGVAKGEAAKAALGEAGGLMTQALDLLKLISDEQLRDEEKWKDRAAAAAARVVVDTFNKGVKSKLDAKKKERKPGWSLNIDGTSHRSCSFFDVEGNLQIYTVNILLQKPDTKANTSPSGDYSGIVEIAIDHVLDAFDSEFLTTVFAKAPGHKDAYPMFKAAGYQYTDDYTPSFVRRNYRSGDYTTNIYVSTVLQSSTKSSIDFSSLSEDTEIQIRHTINADAQEHGIAIMISTEFEAVNEENVAVKRSYMEVTPNGNKKDVFEDAYEGSYQSLGWDENLWESWQNEKTLEVSINS